MLERFDRALSKIENLFAGLGVFGLVFILFSVCLEIVLRGLFNKPQQWVIEFTEYAMLYITFLGTAWLQRQEGHVAVDLLTNALSPSWRRRFSMVSSVLGLFVGTVLAWFGTTATINAFVRGAHKPTVLEFPTWIVLVVIPLGGAVLGLRFLQQLLALASGAPLTRHQPH
ncbi:MAG: TRAP transporter small permease [Rhodospirillales bacterium]|nr:TRAP transporter small permease [Rhodospirillales bacterium]